MANTRFFRWFYGVFVDIFKGKIKDAFVSALKQQVTAAISDINQQYHPSLIVVIIIIIIVILFLFLLEVFNWCDRLNSPGTLPASRSRRR
jgi:flagellar biosynthesis protein FlhB